MKNVTNFCKTVETGVDSRLQPTFPEIRSIAITEEIARAGI